MLSVNKLNVILPYGPCKFYIKYVLNLLFTFHVLNMFSLSSQLDDLKTQAGEMCLNIIFTKCPVRRKLCLFSS